MNNNYKRTFDAVHMCPARQKEMRSELSSRLSIKHKEDYSMSAKRLSFKKSRILIIAAIFVLAFSLMGFAFGNQIIQLLGGGRIEQGKDSDGNDFISISSGFESEPVKVVDGQIYFILDDLDINITNNCSEEKFYEYEKLSDDGNRRVLVIGGTPDNTGMAEFVWDKNGNFIGHNSTYSGEKKPIWLDAAETKFLQS